MMSPNSWMMTGGTPFKRKPPFLGDQRKGIMFGKLESPVSNSFKLVVLYTTIVPPYNLLDLLVLSREWMGMGVAGMMINKLLYVIVDHSLIPCIQHQ